MADCDRRCDFNGDGVVDQLDKDILSAAYGSKPGDANWNPACDLNNDGVINIGDSILFGLSLGCTFETETKKVSLTEGSHTIQISLDGYDTLQATINVTATSVTCSSVVDGACGGTSLPRVEASAWTVTAHLKEAAATNNRCNWIVMKDISKVVFISEMVLAYNDLLDIGFTPSASEISDGVLIYSNLGTPASRWGC